VAHDGRSAIETAIDFRPDALLLDIGLPGLDGFEVAERLRCLPGFARTFIVAASGYGRDADRRRARDVGIDLYLVKPFDTGRLEEVFASCRPARRAVPAGPGSPRPGRTPAPAAAARR
jgi:two-component system CheB/CheR fusion protein